MDTTTQKLPSAPAVSFLEVIREKAFVLIGLGLFAGLCLLGLEYFRAEKDNTALTGVILAVFASLLAYLKSEQSHIITNFRMTQWMENAEKIAENRGYARAIKDLELKELQNAEHKLLEEQQRIAERAHEAKAVLDVAAEKATQDHVIAVTHQDLAQATEKIIQHMDTQNVERSQTTPVVDNEPEARTPGRDALE